MSPNGRLVFQEVPGVMTYRVDWTTNLTAAVWSSNAPGVAAIQPGGAGALTTTVGVSHAFCFYRVAAIVTNTPQGGLTNRFQSDNEGWAIVSYPFRTHVNEPQQTALDFDPSFGNPSGSVRVGDVYGETGIAAPAQYLGNKLGFYGGRIEYDIFLRFSDNTIYPAVILNGGTMSVYYDAPSPLVGAWEHRVTPLTQEGWKVAGSGDTVTESVFKEVLGSLKGIYLYTEWHSGADDTSVDNISMSSLE